jgi:hypothetical protein
MIFPGMAKHMIEFYLPARRAAMIWPRAIPPSFGGTR